MKRINRMTNRIAVMLLSCMLIVGSVPGIVSASEIPTESDQTSETVGISPDEGFSAEQSPDGETENIAEEDAAEDDSQDAADQEADAAASDTVILNADDGDSENELDDGRESNDFAESENNSQKVTVTFDFQNIGTSDNTIIEVDPGSTIEKSPTVPEVSGSILEGWYSDPGFQNKWGFDTAPVNDNIILYAHWVESDEEPAPEDTPDSVSDPEEKPDPEGTPESTPEESSDPDEDPAPAAAAETTPITDPAGKAEAAATEEETPVYPAFHQSQTVQGMVITVSAPEGVFPEGARLLVDLVPNAETESAVEGLRKEDADVTASYSFDIRVVDADGHELQPADEQQVCVFFQIAEIGDENLDTTVYHIPDNGPAEVLNVTEDASSETAAVTTDGFSLYRVEFTCKPENTELIYIVKGDSLPLYIKLSDILTALGLERTVSSVRNSSGDDSYISFTNFNPQTKDCNVIISQTFTGEKTITVRYMDNSEVVITLVMGEYYTDGDWGFFPTAGYAGAVIAQYTGSDTAITIPDTVSNGTITFPVTGIDNEAFKHTCLTSVVIPGGVQLIDEEAFSGCDNLTDIYFMGTKEQWEDISGAPSGTNIHVRYLSGTVTVMAAPADGGTVTGGGWYGQAENEVGESVTVEAIPAAGYVFVNWTKSDGDPSNPESTDAKYTFTYDRETILTAHFSPAVTIKWINDDGKDLYSSLVAVNTLPVYGEPDPTKAEDDDYTYAFKEWSPEVVPVTADATYKAVYSVAKKIGYFVTEGAGQKYTQGSDGPLTFVFNRSESDEETFRHFVGLKCIETLLTPDKDFTAGSGSLIIILQPDFLKTLSVGDYTLTASFDDGPDANVSFTVDPRPSYTVTFHANGHGTAPDMQTVAEGQTVMKPLSPAAAGYTFEGWFTDQACTSPFDFNTPITQDLVLYAKWTGESSVPRTGGSSVPRTGDTNDPGVWIALIGFSVLLLSGAFFTYRKRRRS